MKQEKKVSKKHKYTKKIDNIKRKTEKLNRI